ncbi:MAG TPA: amidase [Opitutae bacterium]|nr:amidase [Myxococcales bacterium]HCR30779.1 amidase [Opitutae bacterium]
MVEQAPSSSRRDFLLGSTGGLALLVSGCQPRSDTASGANKTDFESLLDIDYTDQEWTQILEGYDDQLDRLRSVRSAKLENNQAPAQTFDPRLPGRLYPEKRTDPSVSTASIDRPLPSSEDDIAFAPATHLAHWIKSKQISSRELTDLYLDRIVKFDTKLQAFTTLAPELARKQADAADKEIVEGNYRGPLHGLPYGLKDLFDTAGIRTTWGASVYQDRVPASNAHIVDRLAEAGAVLIGKTSCGAIAYGDIWYGGVTRNPWETREGSSGSSAGSASATAAGLCAFSIGTETLGSIISPSVRCGTVGLRPTFGRVGRSGGMTLCWSLDKIGPICRAIEDTAIVLDAISGFDSSDAATIDTDFSYNTGLDISKLRVGYDPSSFTDSPEHELNRNVLKAIESLGAQVEEIILPNFDYRALMLQLDVEAAAAFEELTLSNRDDELRWQVDRAWPNTWRKARTISAIDYLQVDRMRRQLMGEMDDLFQNVDVVVGDNFGKGMLQMSNFTGHPQLSIPCGHKVRPIRKAFDVENVGENETANLPYSIGFWSQLFEEDKLIVLGHGIELALNVQPNHPPMDFSSI